MGPPSALRRARSGCLPDRIVTLPTGRGCVGIGDFSSTQVAGEPTPETFRVAALVSSQPWTTLSQRRGRNTWRRARFFWALSRLRRRMLLSNGISVVGSYQNFWHQTPLRITLVPLLSGWQFVGTETARIGVVVDDCRSAFHPAVVIANANIFIFRQRAR